MVSSGSVAHGRSKLAREEYMAMPMNKIQALKHKDPVSGSVWVWS